MSTLTEQFAAARTAQLNAQFDFFRSATGKAFANIERLMALNFDTAHSALDKANATVRQLIATEDPRDLLSLTTQTQAHFDSMLQYGRQVLRIVGGLPAQPAEVLALPAPAPAPAAPALELGSTAELNFGKVAVEVTVDEPAVEAPAKEKPIAKAAAKVSGKRAVAPKPAAAFPAPNSKANGAKLKPVEAAPPPAPVAGTPTIEVSKKAAAPAKVAKKK